jgi:hypothetical protein
MDEILFDSKGEMSRYAHLKLEQRAGLITDLRLQPAYPVYIRDQLFTTYTADFAYYRDGVEIIEDVKTSGTRAEPSYRLRKKAAQLYYGIEVQEITGAGKSLAKKRGRPANKAVKKRRTK